MSPDAPAQIDPRRTALLVMDLTTREALSGLLG
jgi:hypothetical protein